MKRKSPTTRKTKKSLMILSGKESLMKSSWGNVKVVTSKHDRLVYGCVRKKYTRAHPYPENTMRIKPLKREKAAIIMLRRKGYPINMLHKVLGRSTSFIHRVLRTAIIRLTLRSIDMRKLAAKTRTYTSGFRWRTLLKYMPMWEKWILGEGDKPP